MLILLCTVTNGHHITELSDFICSWDRSNIHCCAAEMGHNTLNVKLPVLQEIRRQNNVDMKLMC